MASETNANRLLPQPYPSVAYMSKPASGRTAPRMLRNKLLAANADVEWWSKARIRYTWTGMKTAIMAKPNTPRPISGTSQKLFASTDHPYQNNPAGTRMPAGISSQSTFSGADCVSMLAFFFAILSIAMAVAKTPTRHIKICRQRYHANVG